MYHWFTHVASHDNTTSNATILDLPEILNGNPDALISVSQRWDSEGGISGTYNPHHFAIYYDRVAQRWLILNTDQFEIPIGSRFAVSCSSGASASFFRHTATSSNTYGNSTTIDHPSLNARTGALFVITPRLQRPSVSTILHNLRDVPYFIGPGGAPAGQPTDSTSMNHSAGIWYNNKISKWVISFLDFEPIHTDLPQFNIEVLDQVYYPSGADHTRVVIAEQPTSMLDFIVDPHDPPTMKYWVTHTLSFSISDSVYLSTVNSPSARMLRARFNNHPIGVRWNERTNRPSIINEDKSVIERGCGFVVRHY